MDPFSLPAPTWVAPRADMDPFSLPAPSLYDIVTSLPFSWRYLSEGAANIVFAYVGPAGPLTSTVLRASKRAPDGAAAAPAAALPATLPSPLAPFFPSPSYLPRSTRVARPPRLAAHPAPWLLALRAEVAGAPARPACRLGGGALPADCALQLLEDAAAGAPTALCVELKPKCGLPPGGRGAPCRFCATQLVKCARPQRLSRFCPLELYSGDPPRVEGALRRLVGTPQNNLRVFCGGARVWGGEDGGGGTPADFGIALLRAGWPPRQCALAGIGAAAGGAAAAAAAPAADAAERAAADFLAAVAAALCEPHSPLPALRGVQALGALAGNSAGGARDALAALGGGGGAAAREWEWEWGGVCRALQRACAAGALPPPPTAGGGGGSALAVAGFLLAATAMDASVMMAVRPAGGGGGGGAREWHAVAGAGVEVAWAVVDAELKSAEKLDSWVAAEAARREAWERGGAQRFAEEGKVCAALAHAEEEPAEGLCPA
jgi:hypothetical protein